MVTMAKPLANGYPIGAVMMTDSIAQVMSVGGYLSIQFSGGNAKLVLVGTHGTTFGGSPLACAIGYHVLSRLSDHSFVNSLGETSTYLQGRLARLPTWFPDVIQPEIRGKGLILGLGFKDETAPAKVVQLARERGVLLLTAGKDAVRLVPSLNIGAEEVDAAVDVIESCLSVLDK